MRVPATMSSRRVAGSLALCAAALLSGCSAGDDGGGATGASVTATPSRSSLSAASVARFPRTPAVTALGDVTTLDVCAVAASADVTGAGNVRLERPDFADVGSCTLTSRPTGTLAGSGSVGSIAVSVRTAGPGSAAPFDGAPTTVLAAGLPFTKYPFNTTLRSCPRVLTFARAGVAPAVVTIANTRGAGNATPDQQCLLNERIAARFVLVAGGGGRPALPVSSPSLLSVDVCRAAAAGRVATTIKATAVGQTRAYGAGCAFPTDLGTVDLTTGTLGPGVVRPAGAGRDVDGRRFVLLPTAAPTCGYAWSRGREVMTARLSSATASVPADCVLAADALTAYLDVLEPR